MSIAVTTVLALVGSASLPASSECARILAIETAAARSTWNFMSAVLGALSDRGHEVTVFTPLPDGDRPNYTEVDVSDVYPRRSAMGFGYLTSGFNDQWSTLSFQLSMTMWNCDGLHRDRRLRELLAAGLRERFDAILVDHIMLDCASLEAVRSGLPLIFAVSVSTYFLRERRTLGHLSNPATATTVMSGRAAPRTFTQRLRNAVSTVYGRAVVAILDLWLGTAEPRLYELHGPVAPSLVFLNDHFVSGRAGPTPANVVSVGGVHLKPARAVPADVLEFIENSTHGVVLFTFGSTVDMSSIPEDIQNLFKETLALIPQNVIMKYDGEMNNKPKNVMTRKWLPQRDILKHRKVKLFISHGGISGMYEAVDAGVPVLGFPLFYDQYRNIDNLVESGMAISMDLFSLTRETFLKNIFELVNNKTYIENARISSNIFNDRPMTPNETVVYWTEYVIRHKGAPHLKSPAIDLMWYQYFLLDVFAVLAILVCLIFVTAHKVFRICYEHLVLDNSKLNIKKKFE